MFKLRKTTSKMAEPPKNGVQNGDFLTEVDFSKIIILLLFYVNFLYLLFHRNMESISWNYGHIYPSYSPSQI